MAFSINDGIIRIEFPDESEKKVDEALDHFRRGIRKAKQGDYKRAIQLLSKAVGILPYHTEARRNLAMAYLELGNVEEARNHLIDVLRLDPKDAWGYLLLGNTYFMYEKDHNSAEPFYKKAYEFTPNDEHLLNNYAALKAEKNQFAEARAMLRARRFNSFLESVLDLSDFFLGKNNPYEGLQCDSAFNIQRMFQFEVKIKS
jgi:Flp pilus assembly protein TadD